MFKVTNGKLIKNQLFLGRSWFRRRLISYGGQGEVSVSRVRRSFMRRRKPYEPLDL